MNYDKKPDAVVVGAFDAYRRSEILLEMAKETVRQRYDHTLVNPALKKEWEALKERLAYAIPPGPAN